MGYFKQTFRGVSWVSAFRMASRAISLLRITILARILLPVQFGVFGIATLVLAFLEILTETGINVFLIQKKETINKYIDTAWVVSIFRGSIISLVIFLLAKPISNFFSSPQSLISLYLISLVPLIRGFINPSVVKYQKELNFRAEFFFKFSVFVFDASLAIIFALITKRAESMIVGLIGGAVLETVLSFVLVKPRPKFVFHKQNLKEVLSVGKWLTGAGIFRYFFTQGDDIVVGRMLGEGNLGLYQVAYKVSTLPVSEVTDVFNKVVFPVYVKISDDLYRLKRAFLKTTFVVASISAFAGILIFTFPEQIVTLLLGDKWIEAVPILKILAVFGVIQAISNSMYSLLLALKKQKQVSFITFVGLISMIVGIFPLTENFGVLGAALAPLIGSIVTLPVMSYIVYKSLIK